MGGAAEVASIFTQDGDQPSALFPDFFDASKGKHLLHTHSTFKTEPVESPWDKSDIQQPNQPLDDELKEKFIWLASGMIAKSRAKEIEEKIINCDKLPDVKNLTELLAAQ